jgi:hypothetical protein
MKKTVAAGGNAAEFPYPLLDVIKALHRKSQTGKQ